MDKYVAAIPKLSPDKSVLLIWEENLRIGIGAGLDVKIQKNKQLKRDNRMRLRVKLSEYQQKALLGSAKIVKGAIKF